MQSTFLEAETREFIACASATVPGFPVDIGEIIPASLALKERAESAISRATTDAGRATMVGKVIGKTWIPEFWSAMKIACAASPRGATFDVIMKGHEWMYFKEKMIGEKPVPVTLNDMLSVVFSSAFKGSSISGTTATFTFDRAAVQSCMDVTAWDVASDRAGLSTIERAATGARSMIETATVPAYMKSYYRDRCSAYLSDAIAVARSAIDEATRTLQLPGIMGTVFFLERPACFALGTVIDVLDREGTINNARFVRISGISGQAFVERFLPGIVVLNDGGGWSWLT